MLNIEPQRFDKGFPGITNRYEWFAIDYKGKIYIPESKTYTFSLLSDDGAKLIIDGKLVIDNDGVHPPEEKRGKVYLKRGLHTVEVQYFQGPRYYVALVLSVIKEGKKVPFDIRAFAPVQMQEKACEVKLTMGSGILFDFNKYNLKKEAREVLDAVVKQLQNIPYTLIVVAGHTDDIGSETYNYRLSLKRAQSVANYLKAKGIPSDAIKTIGYGEKRPRVPNDIPEHRAMNRRVEIVVKKPCETK